MIKPKSNAVGTLILRPPAVTINPAWRVDQVYIQRNCECSLLWPSAVTMNPKWRNDQVYWTRLWVLLFCVSHPPNPPFLGIEWYGRDSSPTHVRSDRRTAFIVKTGGRHKWIPSRHVRISNHHRLALKVTNRSNRKALRCHRRGSSESNNNPGRSTDLRQYLLPPCNRLRSCRYGLPQVANVSSLAGVTPPFMYGIPNRNHVIGIRPPGALETSIPASSSALRKRLPESNINMSWWRFSFGARDWSDATPLSDELSDRRLKATSTPADYIEG